MKRIQYLFLTLLLGLTACNDKDALWNVIDDMDGRITILETICEQMNTNIESIQTLIEAQESGDVITNITEIRSGSTVIGYTITFKNSDPITIYNGTNGKDGADGKDGQNGADGKDGTDGTNGVDGTTPTISVKKDTDNIYYWTLNGEWLLDADGNKLAVTSKGDKGDKGDKGEDGSSTTPMFKIDGGFWYVSYDNGST